MKVPAYAVVWTGIAVAINDAKAVCVKIFLQNAWPIMTAEPMGVSAVSLASVRLLNALEIINVELGLAV